MPCRAGMTLRRVRIVRIPTEESSDASPPAEYVGFAMIKCADLAIHRLFVLRSRDNLILEWPLEPVWPADADADGTCAVRVSSRQKPLPGFGEPT